MKKLAILSGFTDAADARYRTGAVTAALATLGWIEGKTILIDYRQSRNMKRLHTLAEEIVASKPDAIFLTPGYILPMLLRHTRTIPLVFANLAGPVEQGWVKSIAHPGGNATGFTSFEYSIGGQWLHILKEASPRMNRALVVGYDKMFTAMRLLQFVEKAGKQLGVAVSFAPAHSLDNIRAAIQQFPDAAGVGLVCLPHGSLITSNAREIAQYAKARNMLSMYGFRTFADQGGLMSYGNLERDAFRRAANYIDRIFHGEHPSNLPIQNPVAFEFVINLKTAHALDLTIPSSLLARATDVIE